MSLEKSLYKRKTDNPKTGWSDERRAKFSEKCKEAHANNTWFKKSKKIVGRNISNGLKNAAKFRNRSEAMKKSWERRKAAKSIINHPPTTLSENLLDKAPLPVSEKINIKPEVIDTGGKIEFEGIIPALTLKRIEAIFDIVENNFGIRPELNDFIADAINDKISKVFLEIHPSFEEFHKRY